MPSYYWWKSEGWRFKCILCPERIQEYSPTIYQQISEAVEGAPSETWHGMSGCCGAWFIPWARGASQIVEIKVADVWFAILAERCPPELDNEIKKVKYEWHVACGRTTAEDIKKAIPTALPKANLSKKSRIPGVAFFDFEQWEKEQCPTLLRSGWIALAKCIALKADIDMSGIITLCSDLMIKECENPDLKTAMMMSRGIKPTRPCSSSSVEV